MGDLTIGIIIGSGLGALCMCLIQACNSRSLDEYDVRTFLHKCAESDWTQVDHLAIRNRAVMMLARLEGGIK